MTREQFVTFVIALMDQAPDDLARDMGEALVGIGVEVLAQLGVPVEDIAESIRRRQTLS